jgi:Protein of unknown function (DUF3489).
MTMITLQKLTPTQSTIIRSATQHPEGRIALPATLQGGARANALKGLLMRCWIVETGGGHLLTDAGYATIGQQRPSPPPPINDSPARDSVQHGRPGTKLAKVVAALQNPDGATIFQLMCCTGWQPHTIRGAFSGMVKKKLGLNVVSTKSAGGERVYRIA